MDMNIVLFFLIFVSKPANHPMSTTYILVIVRAGAIFNNT